MYPRYWLIVLSKISDDTEMTKSCFFFVEGDVMELYLPVILKAGAEYSVSVVPLSLAFQDTYVPSYLVYDEGSANFRAGAFKRCFN